MQDVNQPVENPILVKAIEAFQEEANHETQHDFLKAVKEATFLLSVEFDPPVPPGENGETTLEADTKIKFIGITDMAGDNYLPVYTDWAALKQWRDNPDEQTMLFSYDDINSMIFNDPQSSGFVINPYGLNVPVRKNIMQILNAGPVNQWTAEKGMQVRIGQPSEDPVEIKEAICEYLKDKANVKSAYLALMENEGELSYLIVVDYTGDRQETFTGIASVAVPLLREGELIDMAPVDSDLGESVVRGFPPFYER